MFEAQQAVGVGFVFTVKAWQWYRVIWHGVLKTIDFRQNPEVIGSGEGKHSQQGAAKECDG